MKTVHTKEDKIAICRKCEGKGYVFDNAANDNVLCTQCNGSGRVLVSGETVLDVRPYVPDF